MGFRCASPNGRSASMLPRPVRRPRRSPDVDQSKSSAQPMKLYLVSLAVGVLVGALYGALNVPSPAPPVVALIGLFGILMGEQIPPLMRHILSMAPVSVAWIEQIRPHMFGHLPAG